MLHHCSVWQNGQNRLHISVTDNYDTFQTLKSDWWILLGHTLPTLPDSGVDPVATLLAQSWPEFNSNSAQLNSVATLPCEAEPEPSRAGTRVARGLRAGIPG